MESGDRFIKPSQQNQAITQRIPELSRAIWVEAQRSAIERQARARIAEAEREQLGDLTQQGPVPMLIAKCLSIRAGCELKLPLFETPSGARDRPGCVLQRAAIKESIE